MIEQLLKDTKSPKGSSISVEIVTAGAAGRREARCPEPSSVDGGPHREQNSEGRPLTAAAGAQERGGAAPGAGGTEGRWPDMSREGEVDVGPAHI